MLKMTRDQFLMFVAAKDNKITNAIFPPDMGHYLDYFDKYQETGRKVNWNWAGLFAVWFFYRKMYIYWLSLLFLVDTITYIFSDVICALVLSVDRFSIVYSLLRLCTMVGTALYGDYIYLRYATKMISQGKGTGGVNNWVFLVIIFQVLLGFLSPRFLEN